MIEGRPLEARPARNLQLGSGPGNGEVRQNRHERSNVAIFLTGSTGYIGAHVAANLLEQHGAPLNLLVRARDPQEAAERLWQALQLHLDFPRFYEYLQTRMRIFCGDLTAPQFGLAADDYDRLVHTTDSVIHCAASLNRKSEKSCLNVNLRGTLEVMQLAQQVELLSRAAALQPREHGGGGGKRQNEVVTEDNSIDWNRSDYDPYARTKKFCEHMIRQLLPEVPKTIFRPSIVLGDSRYRGDHAVRHGAGVRVSGGTAGAAVPPERRDRHRERGFRGRCDRHAAPERKAAVRHLSSFVRRGLADFRELTERSGGRAGQTRPGVSAVPGKAFRCGGELCWPTARGRWPRRFADESFMPYLVWNTVFDNTRVTTELGRKPVPFSQYSFRC